MTKKIEEFLDIDPIPDKDESEREIVEVTPSSALVKQDEHDNETNDIRKKALDAFDDIMELGKNVEPSRSARMFEVAGQFLRTGLDAVNSKADKQLKTAKLRMEAKKLQVDDETLDKLEHGAEIFADRNSILKKLVGESNKNTIDIDPKEDE